MGLYTLRLRHAVLAGSPKWAAECFRFAGWRGYLERGSRPGGSVGSGNGSVGSGNGSDARTHRIRLGR